VAHFRRTDAEGEGAECAVGARVAVATNNRLARLGCPEFRANNMHDPAPTAAVPQEIESEFLAVALHLPDLIGSAFTGHEQVLKGTDWRGRRRVVERRQRKVRAPDRQVIVAQHGKRLRGRHLMNDV
jgi:hypothetical protein